MPLVSRVAYFKFLTVDKLTIPAPVIHWVVSCLSIIMKRYRVLGIDFDTRANYLKTEIKDEWDENVKASWYSNKNRIKEGLLHEFGVADGNNKIQNFIEIGSPPLSFISFHNKFLKQIRYAFVVGSYYPSLVGACSLGERILNQLIIHLRNDFKSTTEYKKVYKKQSFDNWDVAIETLSSWKVILPKVAKDFKKLKKLRNKAIHFNPETDKNDKSHALKAIKKLQEIICDQFGIMTKAPWYIPDIKGASFIKKDYEKKPFVREIILPNCKLVGYKHELEHNNGEWTVIDSHDYGNKSVTDNEFKNLYNSR